MKNLFILLGILAMSVLTSCSKDDIELKNQVGTWNVTESQTLTVNGNITNDITLNYTLDLKEDGSGTINQFSNNQEVHWVLDESENKIFLIRTYILQGVEQFSTTRFDINKDTESEQEWTHTLSYTNVNNEMEERFSKWILTK